MPNRIRARHLGAQLTFVAGLVIATHPASSAVIHVRDFVDSAASSTTCTLRQAVRSANENTAIGACEAGQNTGTDQIYVPPGTHVVSLTAGANEDSALTGDLDLLQNVNILGVSMSMSIVDGTSGTEIDRLFDVAAGVTVTMQQLTLRGGNATDATGRGGVIRLVAATSNLTLDEIDLALGTAKTGGGVYSSGVLTILDSRITGNHTVVAAGAGNHGGGVAHDATGGALTITSSEISLNTAEESGAGLWVAGGPFKLVRSRVTSNIGGGTGGGLFVSSNDFKVFYTEFAGNQANAGGGLYSQATGDVERSAFIANIATTTGGGLHDTQTTFVRHSTIADNSAATGGGAYTASQMTLFDADTIASNDGGGGVHNVSGAALENAILSQNVGGNCTGAAPTVGEGNMENTNTCGLVSTPTSPNFPNTNPLLGPIADNGGPTRTMALLSGSPAIDAVSSLIRTNCQNSPDQRGLPRGRPRTNNGVDDVFLCDAGAFEAVNPFAVNTLADGVDANVNDDKCLTAGGLCTLRAAIQQANALPGSYVIQLATGNHVLSISGAGENAGATGDLDIDPPLVIQGAGTGQTTVSGGGLDRVFDIASPAGHVASDIDATTIRNLTITGGAAGSENGGGVLLRNFPLELRGVRVFANSTQSHGSAMSSTTGFGFDAGDKPVRLIDSVVENNTGGRGAVFLHEALILRSGLLDNVSTDAGSEFARVEIVDSTVSGNDASSWGGFFAFRAAIDSSTIFNNTADFSPAGVWMVERSGVRNSIIANNRVSGTTLNCESNSLGIGSGGKNISDTAVTDCELDDATDRNLINPQLGALAANGGLARSHLLLAGSPAIDTGTSSSCPLVDQRGVSRPQDGDGNGSSICDVGAVELPEPGFLAGFPVAFVLLAGLSRRRDPARTHRRCAGLAVRCQMQGEFANERGER